MHRWKLSVLAAAAALSAGLYATEASALALGRITVQSALGEPLRAEIELPQITTAEADTLRTVPAAPEVFRAQGMEFSPAVSDMQIALQRRADGSMVLRLSSSRPINDPFVDLVLDASWNSGHLVRSYTMLFDPPAMRRPAPAVTASPQVTAPPAPTPRAAAPASPPTPAVAGTPSSPAPRATPAPRPAPAARPAPAPASASADSVTVRSGDTASRLAGANRPSGVSLDQMLVAMMRANPDAFVNGNVNRLRAGAVLQLPSETQAQATPAAEARQIIAAQSRDFNDYRRRLASGAPSTTVATADRSASGKVQTQVEERKPAAAAPDRLTLSKGAVQGQRAAEDQIARDKQASDASTRMAEMSKNIADLNKLNAASAPVPAPAPAAAPAPAPTPTAAPATPPATGPAVAVPGVPATPSEPASAPVAEAPAAPASEAASAPAEPASTPAEAPAAAPVEAASAPGTTPLPPPQDDSSFFDTLTGEPLFMGGALAIVLALLGFGGYRMAQRKRNQSRVDSSFLESRLQPDSFFGASGGQRVDTANSELTTGSSMSYSPSQLDAGGDVDPVAEADVYLAYGRDLQAEEILKEALRHNPSRTSVHVKLGEIYAKRQDRRAFEATAAEVHKLTQGDGPDWARMVDLGSTLDPENPLYQPGGRPGLLETPPPQPTHGFASTMPQPGEVPAAAATAAALPPDFDLDLDLDLPDDALADAPPSAPAAPGAFAAAAAAAATAQAQAAREPEVQPEPEPELPPAAEPRAAAPAPAPTPELDLDDLDLDLPEASWDRPASVPPATPPAPSVDLDFPEDELSLADSANAPLSPRPAAPAPVQDFDLGSLSLDLNAPTTSLSSPAPAPVAAAEPAADVLPDDPLDTKLALAQEFNAIGDSEGARTLIEEVIAESSGELKARAQRLLAELR